MPEQPQSPFYNFPRFFPMRGGGGYGGSRADAISRFGDDIASSLMQIKAQMDQKKQDQLANAMMNNGQVPGAAPYVRQALATGGNAQPPMQATPFDSTGTPYSGGQQQAAGLAQGAAQMQQAQQKALANALAQRGQQLRSRQLDLEERNIGTKAKGPVQKPDTYDALAESLKKTIPKDDAMTLAELGRANWKYPAGDPNTTSLETPTGEEEPNPDWVGSQPSTGLGGTLGIGSPASQGTPPNVPRYLPKMRSVDVPTGQAKSLFERLQALNQGKPSTSPQASAAPAGNSQIAQAQAWLDDPANKDSELRDQVAAKLADLSGQ